MVKMANTLIETAKACEPALYRYLRFLLEELPYAHGAVDYAARRTLFREVNHFVINFIFKLRWVTLLVERGDTVAEIN